MSDTTRYTFGNVDGIMKEGTGVCIGMDGDDRVTIHFKYRDAEGKWWAVAAHGWRMVKAMTSRHVPMEKVLSGGAMS